MVFAIGQDSQANGSVMPGLGNCFNATGWRAMAKGAADGVNGVDNYAGLTDYSTTLMTYHGLEKWSGGYKDDISQYFQNDAWIDFYGPEVFHDSGFCYEIVNRDYTLPAPVKPSFVMEGSYEDGIYEGSLITPAYIRVEAWNSLFGAVCGYTYGHCLNWQQTGSIAHLETPGAAQMGVLADFADQHAWWRWVPDNGLVAANAGSGATRKVGARSNAGDECVVYYPDNVAATITNLLAVDTTATWFDPRNGHMTGAGAFAVGQSRSMAPPATWEDAVLFLADSAQTAATPSLTPNGGITSVAVDVQVDCATPGAEVRYTLDGSEPTAASILAGETVRVSATSTLKAKAFKAGLAASHTAAADFVIAGASGQVVNDEFDDGALTANPNGVGSGWNVRSYNGAATSTESGGTFNASMGTENGVGAIMGKDVFTLWDDEGATVTWIVKDITVQTPHAYNCYLAYCAELGIISANADRSGSEWVMSGPNRKGGFYISVGKKNNTNAVELWIAVSNKSYTGVEGASGFLRTTQTSTAPGGLGVVFNATFPLTVTATLTRNGWSVTTGQAGFTPLVGNWTTDLIRTGNNASITDEFANGAFLFTAGRNHGIDGSGSTYTPNSGRFESVSVLRNADPQVAAPTFTPPAGTYPTAQTVTIGTSTDGADIWYTLDGSPPTATGGTPYTGSVVVAATSTLMAIATRPGSEDSPVTSGLYSIGATSTGELLVNSGFDAGVTGWTSNGAGSLARITSDYQTGPGALQYSSRALNWNGPQQTITAPVGTHGPGDYAVSAWMRLASGGSLVGRVEIGLTTASGTTYPSVTGTVSSTGWTRVSGTVHLDWTGTLTTAKFFVNTVAGITTLLVDDCSLMVIDTASPPSGSVVNGSFENGTNGWTVTASDGNPPSHSVLDVQGATDGSYSAAFGNANAVGNAVFAQCVATLAGGTYTLHFDYGAFGATNRQQRLLAESLDGTTVLASLEVTALGPGNFLATKTTFATRSLVFTAVSATTTIRFTDLTTLANSNSCDGMLDKVEIVAPDPALVALQDAYVAQEFGMFLHYSMGTYTGEEWASPNRPTDTFAPTALDTDQWAAAAKVAGMRYGVLTVKHHDGFALWDTSQSGYDVAATSWFATQAPGQGDIVKRYADSFRAQGLKVGFYYSIWDRSNGIDGTTLTSRQATDHVKAELTELLGNYGPIHVIWTDGWGWKGWHEYVLYQEVYDHIKSLSPSTVLVENNHTAVNTDIRTYEQSPLPPEGNVFPSELCATIRADGKWFWSAGADATRSVEVLREQRSTSNARTAAYLLDVTPDPRGMIPDSQLGILSQLGSSFPMTDLVIAAFHYEPSTGVAELTLRGPANATYRCVGCADARFDGTTSHAVQLWQADAPADPGTVSEDGTAVAADADGNATVWTTLGGEDLQFFRLETSVP